MTEIFQDVSRFIQNATKEFFKSQLNQIGLNPATASEYIDCFLIAQKTPKITIHRIGTRTVVKKSIN